MPPIDVFEVADHVKRASHRLKNCGDLVNYSIGLRIYNRIKRQKNYDTARSIAHNFLTHIDGSYDRQFPIGTTLQQVFSSIGYEDGSNTIVGDGFTPPGKEISNSDDNNRPDDNRADDGNSNLDHHGADANQMPGNADDIPGEKQAETIENLSVHDNNAVIQDTHTDDPLDHIDAEEVRNQVSLEAAQRLFDHLSTARDMAQNHGNAETEEALSHRVETYNRVIEDNTKTVEDIEKYKQEGVSNTNMAKIFAAVEGVGGVAAMTQKVIEKIPGEGTVEGEFIEAISHGTDFTKSAVEFAHERHNDASPEMSDKSFEKLTGVLKEGANIVDAKELKAGFGVAQNSAALVNNAEEGKTPEAALAAFKLMTEKLPGPLKMPFEMAGDVAEGALKVKESTEHYHEAGELRDHIEEQAEQQKSAVEQHNDQLNEHRNEITAAQAYIANGKAQNTQKILDKLVEAYPELNKEAYKEHFEKLSGVVQHQSQLYKKSE